MIKLWMTKICVLTFIFHAASSFKLYTYLTTFAGKLIGFSYCSFSSMIVGRSEVYA
jgi:hypothetical protein